MVSEPAPAKVATAQDDPWRGWNPFDPSYDREQLYEHLHLLRSIDPVNETPVGLWRLTRYSDVVRLIKELPAGMRRTDGSSYSDYLTKAGRHGRAQFMLFQDPPTHTRLRKLVSRAFTPRAIERTRASIERIVGECLDRVVDADEMDVIADLALPLPSTVICEMLGVPLVDRPKFTEWTSLATHNISPQPFPDEAALARGEAAAMKLADYFEALIAERRNSLGDDLMSELIRVEEQGDRLSTLELVSQTIGLLIAGFETTIGLIGNGVRALLLHPGELEKLRANPALIETAVEECLRWDGPIPITLRVLHADAEIGGKHIAKDSIVLGILAAANRDPEVFPDPDRFDIERCPNEHLAFGGGVHFCLGAHLARLEGQIAIGSLVTRFPHLELVSPRREWGISAFRVPGRLPVRIRR